MSSDRETFRSQLQLKPSMMQKNTMTSRCNDTITLVQAGTIRTHDIMTSFTYAKRTKGIAYDHVEESESTYTQKSFSQRDMLTKYKSIIKNNDGTQKNIESVHDESYRNNVNENGRSSISSQEEKPQTPIQRQSMMKKNRRKVRFVAKPEVRFLPLSSTSNSTMTRKRNSSLMSVPNCEIAEETIRDIYGYPSPYVSFPMKLRIMIERHELERAAKRQKRTAFVESPSQKWGDCQGSDRNSHQETKKDSCSNIVDNNKKDDIIIGWISNGRAFKIYDEERFVKEILPLYFYGRRRSSSSSRISHKIREPSSYRQFHQNLKLWGFTDMPCVEGPATRMIHICSHPSFVRDDPIACSTLELWEGVAPVPE